MLPEHQGSERLVDRRTGKRWGCEAESQATQRQRPQRE
jgi:hypothetical protein